ncbi:MAG: hypothetical protein AB1705_13045 [Verrucomicrobiota bacterium]
MKKLDLVSLILVAAVGLLLLSGLSYPLLGLFPFGPTATHTVKIQRAYVDVSGSKNSTQSHYIIGTDKGVFEVDNSIINGIANADEIYAGLQPGKTYRVKVRGNKVVNFFFQSYPHIVEVKAE